MNVFEFFTDPILRAPTIGSMLMCLACSLVGVLVFLRKESLLAESLSHASYPGVILGTFFIALFFPDPSQKIFWTASILFFALLTSFLGLILIHTLQKKWRVSADSTLSFVLSSFFGIGILLASSVQFSFTNFYIFAQSYLYGQAATMTDIHIVIYGALSLIIILILLLLYKEWQTILFDRSYAKTIGIPTKKLDLLLIFLIVFSVVIGIRSVGVVLISGMFVAPPVAARQFSHHLGIVLLISGLFGLLSGFFGNYLSVFGSILWASKYPGIRLSLPTGPMILLFASLITLFSLLFAPKNGLFLRFIRSLYFRYVCIGENILKTIWRLDPDGVVTLEEITAYQPISTRYLLFRLYTLKKNGWIKKTAQKTYQLTVDGKHKAAKIVRLHRLWEVYLASYLGVGKEKVHLSAEAIEHVITPSLEEELTLLLRDPKKDPHNQPIPPRREKL